jgi:hypothetical protein
MRQSRIRWSMWLGAALVACGGESVTLEITVPPPAEVVPQCQEYVAIRLMNGDFLLPCRSIQQSTSPGAPASTARIVCDDDELMPDTPYVLKVAYYVGSTVVAEGSWDEAATPFAAGEHKRELPPERIRTDLDTDLDGVSNLDEACP